MTIRVATLLTLLMLCHNSIADEETRLSIIPLAPPLDQPNAEISGLTWCGETLIIMPQYPRRLSPKKENFFYTLSKQTIIDFLQHNTDKVLQATPIRVEENGLRKEIAIFDGFEAVACDGNIDPKNIWSLDSQSEMRNIGDEAILLNGDQVISLHEVNDPRIVESAAAHSINSKTGVQTSYDFPHLPFRITDSTELDANNRFWVINYKYSGDKFSRKSNDPLALRYGEGDSHAQYDNVERLVEFQITGEQIKRTERAPIQLLMESSEGRNWEGLVRLDELGFLIATDKHPDTLFGFVPFKSNPTDKISID